MRADCLFFTPKFWEAVILKCRWQRQQNNLNFNQFYRYFNSHVTVKTSTTYKGLVALQWKQRTFLLQRIDANFCLFQSVAKCSLARIGWKLKSKRLHLSYERSKLITLRFRKTTSELKHEEIKLLKQRLLKLCQWTMSLVCPTEIWVNKHNMTPLQQNLCLPCTHTHTHTPDILHHSKQMQPNPWDHPDSIP